MRAIVILYDGLAPSERVMKSLNITLAESGCLRDIQSVKMYTLNEQEIIANVAVARIPTTVKLSGNDATNVSLEAQAVLKIANKYKNLIADKDLKTFETTLLMDICTAKIHNTDTELLRAVEILAKPGIAEHLRFEKTEDLVLWTRILEVIRKVFRFVCQGQNVT